MFKGIIKELAEGKYPEKKISTKRGEFVVKYPSGKDLDLIARLKASAFGGMPLASFDMSYQGRVQRNVTLEIVIISYPNDFPEEWRKENIGDFPDEEVLNLIYKEFNIFRSETQDRISKQS